MDTDSRFENFRSMPYSEASGMIDKRTLEKYEKDAKEAGRDSWYLSWALDTNAEERAKVCNHIG